MVDHLRDAARQRHESTLARATEALHAMSKSGEPISFTAVARRAGISTDFLYRHPELRTRITDLRRTPEARSEPASPPERTNTSSAVRALSAQIKELRAQHHREISRLNAALAAAHGENLKLRRILGESMAHS